MVLFPGYDGDGKGTFAKLSKLIGKKFSCIIIDYPYYRKTTNPYSLAELVDHAHRQIKMSKSNKLHLLGFSMGGFLASAYSAQYSNDITSLTLVSSSVQPNLTTTYRALNILAYHAFKLRILAKLFSIVYCSPLLANIVKHSPLPKPRDNFPPNEAYPLFGTLANVLFDTINSAINTQIMHLPFDKTAILFKDDASFPADIYAPILSNLGFRVTVKNTGGHAASLDYWNQVASKIIR